MNSTQTSFRDDLRGSEVGAVIGARQKKLFSAASSPVPIDGNFAASDPSDYALVQVEGGAS